MNNHYFKSYSKPISFVIIVSLVMLYILCFSYLGILKHLTFKPYYYELDISSRNYWFITTKGYEGFCEVNRYLHNAPLYMVLSQPVTFLFFIYYSLFPYPEALIILQSIVIAFSGLVIYLMAKLKTKNNLLAISLSFSFLVNPVINFFTLYNISTNILGLLFILCAFYFFEKGSTIKLAFFFIILAMLTKINIIIEIAILSFCLLLNKNSKSNFWKMIFFVSISWLIFLVVCIFFLEVANKKIPMWVYHLENYGGSFPEITRAFLKTPFAIIQNLFNNDKNIIFLLFLPLNFTPFFSPVYLFSLLFDFCYIIFIKTRSTIFFSMIAFVYVASIYGCGRLIALIDKYSIYLKSGNQSKKILSGLILFLSLISHYYFPIQGSDPIPFSKGFDFDYYRINKHHRIGHDFLKLIPYNASCTTQYPLFQHLTHQEKINAFEISLESQFLDYVFLDVNNHSFPFAYPYITPNEYYEKLKLLLNKNSYGVLYYNDGWLLLKRGNKPNKNHYILKIINRYLKS